MLETIWFLSAQSSTLSWLDCNLILQSKILARPPNIVSLTNLTSSLSNPLYQSLIKMLNNIGFETDLCETSLFATVLEDNLLRNRKINQRLEPFVNGGRTELKTADWSLFFFHLSAIYFFFYVICDLGKNFKKLCSITQMCLQEAPFIFLWYMNDSLIDSFT